VAGALIAPLRHPLLAAKQLATLDLLSEGRLVVQPTVSWHRAEYEALGVPFGARGELLDEHLAVWHRTWRTSPASYGGRRYPFEDVWVEPKPSREGGPPLWFGGSSVHPRLLRRFVRYGSGFNPLGRPSDADLQRLRSALDEAGRDLSDLELVGGTRGTFAGTDGVADLGAALASVPDQVAREFTTTCIKPSQFLDDAARIGPWCEEVIERVGALIAER
jgi:alkanesulfonate monooxygenase SsuD/methylene tetrahydromethanopterin reductase-like flavin-dependent oxidoreductase (luciferase family)